jgi:hypothetical protein
MHEATLHSMKADCVTEADSYKQRLRMFAKELVSEDK